MNEAENAERPLHQGSDPRCNGRREITQGVKTPNEPS